MALDAIFEKALAMHHNHMALLFDDEILAQHSNDAFWTLHSEMQPTILDLASTEKEIDILQSRLAGLKQRRAELIPTLQRLKEAMATIQPRLCFQRGTLSKDLVVSVFRLVGRRHRQTLAVCCKWFHEVSNQGRFNCLIFPCR